MALEVGWAEVALRLALAVVAGFLIGLNRGERGRAAGLRTHLLVCLAASVAMIQANLLLPTRGKAQDSFIQLDAMRLPLGILTGMGFIGAGAVLRRGNLIIGVTTAATLWLTTVIGLCFGGGQLGLGSAALALALAALWGLRWVEDQLPRERRATLTLSTGPDGPGADEVGDAARAEGYLAAPRSVTTTERGAGARCRTLRFDVRWFARPTDSEPPAFLRRLEQREGVRAVKWARQGE